MLSNGSNYRWHCFQSFKVACSLKQSVKTLISFSSGKISVCSIKICSFISITFLRQITWAVCQEPKCKDCIIITEIHCFCQENKMGLNPNEISPSRRLLRAKLIRTLPFSSDHLLLHNLKTALQAKYFNQKLWDTLQTERRVEKRRRRAEGETEKEDCIGFECLGPSCK